MPTYRIDRSWEWNYRAGPQRKGPFPKVPPTTMKDFLGIPVRSRVGISAGILLNARWIGVYARLGFDILTYKTVRSVARPSYPAPNWVFIEEGERAPQRSPGPKAFRVRRSRPRDAAGTTAAVSFGMPSMEPAVWTADVRRARALLEPGKALVVSVVASPEPGTGRRELVLDFKRLSEMAAEAGAQVVEANLSCPNVSTAEGCVYLDASLSREVMAEMKRSAGKVPVVAKAGHFEDERALRAFLRAVAGRADAVLLINAISHRVVDRRGRPAFGTGREVCGVIGRRIGPSSLRNVEAALEAVRADRLDLQVLAGGGILSPQDAAPYFQAGAHAVMMGGAPMYDPRLAVRMKRAHPEW